MVQTPDPRSKTATTPRAKADSPRRTPTREKKAVVNDGPLSEQAYLHEALGIADERGGLLTTTAEAFFRESERVLSSMQDNTPEEHEAEQIFARVHSELAIEEAMTQRLLARYGL